jgi:hypothetical protein
MVRSSENAHALHTLHGNLLLRKIALLSCKNVVIPGSVPTQNGVPSLKRQNTTTQ